MGWPARCSDAIRRSENTLLCACIEPSEVKGHGYLRSCSLDVGVSFGGVAESEEVVVKERSQDEHVASGGGEGEGGGRERGGN